jgi:DNA-directed RNA polymerase specialized sigma24 family protein
LAELELLYRERYRVFLRVARATLRDEAAAADAVHDAFVQAVRNRRSFRGDGTLEAWVWRMTLEIAEGTVAATLSAARAALRESLEGVPRA